LKVAVIGAGLAGSEAAALLLKNDISVDLYEMKPKKFSPAHKLNGFAELVCSNSLKSMRESHPQGMLKKELLLLNSIILNKSLLCRIPSGDALAVDRVLLSDLVTKELLSYRRLRVINEEVQSLPEGYDFFIIATGPLSSDSFSNFLQTFLGMKSLYFYDAISPIIDGTSIEYNKVFFGSRYGKGGADYLNIPLKREQYMEFVHNLRSAEKVSLKPFEKPKYYESCLPIEVLAERGDDTLAFGPMKPVGFDESQVGFKPYAVIQLRKEDKAGIAYNIVGFQTKLTINEQLRIFRSLPGLKNAVFLRYGSIHRNTYIDAPAVLNPSLNLKKEPNIYFAGQITGVEGYVESIATGFLSSFFLLCKLKGHKPIFPSQRTALGALISHLQSPLKPYQPSGLHLGLFVKERVSKRKREDAFLKNEQTDFQIFLKEAARIMVF